MEWSGVVWHSVAWCEQAGEITSTLVLVVKHAQVALVFSKQLPQKFYQAPDSGPTSSLGEHHTQMGLQSLRQCDLLKRKVLVSILCALEFIYSKHSKMKSYSKMYVSPFPLFSKFQR